MNVSDRLDVLLYSWLSEPDRRRAEQRFADYFRAAFPQLCRYLRSLRIEPAAAEDLAQHALIKFFNHLGIERRTADELVCRTATDLKTLAFGELHARRLERWRGQIRSFRDAAIGFSVSDEAALSGTWQDLRDEINGRIDPLHRDGWGLIAEVHVRLEGALVRLAETPIGTDLSVRSSVAAAAVLDLSDGSPRPDEAVQGFVGRMLQLADSRGAFHLDEAVRCSGAAAFVSGIHTVCERLPALAVPSNGLLYTIAKRLFLDDRKKRRPESPLAAAESALEANENVLEALDLESTVASEAPSPLSAEGAMEGEGLISGREHCDEIRSRYRTFIEFLRAPLTRAEAALAAVSIRGKAKTEQARVESLRAKYQRLMAVLTALHECPQPSEEEIARRQGLTRNQVKYAIERIRVEFQHFFPDMAREAQGRRKHQGGES